MVEIEKNYKIVVSEDPHVPGMTVEEAREIRAANIRQVFIYISIEYTDYNFRINATLTECILKEACGKVLRSDTLDEVEHDELFKFDEDYNPMGFGAENIGSRVIEFIESNESGHRWLRKIRKYL